MHITQETATFIVLGLQAVGTFSAIIYGVVRIERRFTTLELNLKHLKEHCPSCTQK